MHSSHIESMGGMKNDEHKAEHAGSGESIFCDRGDRIKTRRWKCSTVRSQDRAAGKKNRIKKSLPEAPTAFGRHCTDFVSLQNTKYLIETLYCEDPGKSMKRQ